jgi:hypothetical protein
LVKPAEVERYKFSRIICLAAIIILVVLVSALMGFVLGTGIALIQWFGRQCPTMTCSLLCRRRALDICSLCRRGAVALYNRVSQQWATAGIKKKTPSEAARWRRGDGDGVVVEVMIINNANNKNNGTGKSNTTSTDE